MKQTSQLFNLIYFFEAASYGIGGHYNLHHDYLPEYADQLAHLGQRYATFMVYLSDLPLGGATAFPHLDLSFFPSKGKQHDDMHLLSVVHINES